MEYPARPRDLNDHYPHPSEEKQKHKKSSAEAFWAKRAASKRDDKKSKKTKIRGR
jgi:hypothetical protein